MDKLRQKVEELERTINYAIKCMDDHQLPELFRAVFTSLINHMRDVVVEFKQIANDLPIARKSSSTFMDAPPVHFVEFSLYPGTQELEIKGVKYYIPRYDFSLLYDMSINLGMDVQFKHTASLMTHLSKLRRDFPILKGLIVAKGKGVYCLNANIRE